MPSSGMRARNNVSSVLHLLDTANIFPSALIVSAVMTEATSSSETPVLTKTTRRHIAEDGNPPSQSVRSRPYVQSLCLPYKKVPDDTALCLLQLLAVIFMISLPDLVEN
jgi:hypothetical protein